MYFKVWTKVWNWIHAKFFIPIAPEPLSSVQETPGVIEEEPEPPAEAPVEEAPVEESPVEEADPVEDVAPAPQIVSVEETVDEVAEPSSEENVSSIIFKR